MEFMNDTQRDPRLNEILCPFYDRTRTLQLINRYETDPNFISRGINEKIITRYFLECCHTFHGVVSFLTVY